VTREQVKVFHLLCGFLPAFVAYLPRAGRRIRSPSNDRRTLRLILAAAVVFRITLCRSRPSRRPTSTVTCGTAR